MSRLRKHENTDPLFAALKKDLPKLHPTQNTMIDEASNDKKKLTLYFQSSGTTALSPQSPGALVPVDKLKRARNQKVPKISKLHHNGKPAFRVYYAKNSFLRPNGGYAWYRSESEAQQAIKTNASYSKKFGELAGTVTLAELVQARRATDELQGTGFSLLDAAEQVKSALSKALTSRSVKEGLNTYLAGLWEHFQARKKTNPRCEPRHWRNVKATITRLSPLGNLSLRELSSEQLRPLFKGLSKASLRSHTRNLNAAFNFCISEGWMDTNPARCLDRVLPKKESQPRIIKTFSVAETRRFMEAVLETDMRAVPYFAVCFFAGVRPEAAMRLKWSDVGGNGYLYVPHSANKSGHAYNVEILPVLRRWLDWWESQGNVRNGDILPLSASSLKRIRKEALKKAGLVHWIQDGTRKTFATAHRGTFKCKVRTSAALGHKGTSVLDQHYDSRLMTETEAKEFWEILPPETEARDAEEVAGNGN